MRDEKLCVATILASCLFLALLFGVAGCGSSGGDTPAGGVGQVKLVREGGRWPVDYELGQWYGLAPGMT